MQLHFDFHNLKHRRICEGGFNRNPIDNVCKITGFSVFTTALHCFRRHGGSEVDRVFSYSMMSISAIKAETFS